jgi:hypothetical protein
MITECLKIKHRSVLITGQGRSGTSAVASIFYNLGYYMPSACKLSTLEDEILRQYLSGGNIESIVAELSLRQSQHNLVAWKDPKLYKKYGRELIKLLGKDWVYVIIFRDPYAIAMRNNLSMSYDRDDALLMGAKNNWKLLPSHSNLD